MRHTDPRAAYAARTAQIHAKLAQLTLLSPAVVKGLLAGRPPRALSLIRLKNHKVRSSWGDQALFGRMDR